MSGSFTDNGFTVEQTSTGVTITPAGGSAITVTKPNFVLRLHRCGVCSDSMRRIREGFNLLLIQGGLHAVFRIQPG